MAGLAAVLFGKDVESLETGFVPEPQLGWTVVWLVCTFCFT